LYSNSSGPDIIFDFGAIASVLPANTWTHVAVALDRTGNQIIGYINGVQTGTPKTLNETITSIGDLGIGARVVVPDNYANVAVDDFRVYDRAPAASEVLALYEGVTPTPIATLIANPTTINSGQSSTLTWSSTNATACTGTGFSTGNAASGGPVAVSPTTTTTYSMACTGAGGTSPVANATVTVSNPAPTANLTASPTTINSGQSSNLSWSSTNATSCTGTGFSTGNAVSGGPVTVSPKGTTTYSVTCTGAGGTSSPANATVTVNACSFTPDLSQPGTSWTLIHGAFCTLNNPINAQPWQTSLIEIKQSNLGGDTISNYGSLFLNSTFPTLSTVPNAKDLVSVAVDGEGQISFAIPVLNPHH
jgi:hypothetical protein